LSPKEKRGMIAQYSFNFKKVIKSA